MLQLLKGTMRYNKSTFMIKRMLSSGEESDVLFKNLNNAGIIIYNRPKVLNSITTSMMLKIGPKMQEWEQSKKLLIVKGTGDVLSSGGDITKATDKIKGPFFFGSVYKVNNAIRKYKLPYVTFLHGFSMGGALGMGVCGKYRVVTEKTVMAMPETKIGLLPDTGGTYFLPRLQHNLGYYLGLLGDRLKGKDAVKAGLATHFVPSERLQELEVLLSQCNNDTEISTILDKMSEPADVFSLASQIKHINYCFGAATVEEIIERLEKVNNDWSKKSLETLHSLCPGSLKISLRALRTGAQLDLPQCLKMEYQVVVNNIMNHDFPEGVRALLIDKDNKPNWKHKTLADVTEDYVESFFGGMPPGFQELDVC